MLRVNRSISARVTAEFYKTIVKTTNCLFQISILIRKPVQHDRLFGSRREYATNFKPFDLVHVFHKFPNADKKIVEHLGMANSRRRRVFTYTRRQRYTSMAAASPFSARRGGNLFENCTPDLNFRLLFKLLIPNSFIFKPFPKTVDGIIQ
jgi:hypothetical protein